MNTILSSVEDVLSAISREREDALEANDTRTYEQLTVIYREVEDVWVRVRKMQKGVK